MWSAVWNILKTRIRFYFLTYTYLLINNHEFNFVVNPLMHELFSNGWKTFCTQNRFKTDY